MYFVHSLLCSEATVYRIFVNNRLVLLVFERLKKSPKRLKMMLFITRIKLYTVYKFNTNYKLVVFAQPIQTLALNFCISAK